MRRLLAPFVWLVCIAITTKILLPSQQLGIFWIVIIGLSIFFGLPCSRNNIIPEDFSQQQIIWWNKYHGYSYYEKQRFLSETVKRALKIGQVEQVERFLKSIINHDPDNETAQSLLIALWSTEVINNSETVKQWKSGTVKY